MFKVKNLFSSFSSNDLPKAKEFYGKTLGIQVKEEGGMLWLDITNNTRILIYPKSNHVPAEFTVLNMQVNDIENTANELKKRGIQFENYSNEIIKTDETGIFRMNGMKAAWFKDPAGNIISILE